MADGDPRPTETFLNQLTIMGLMQPTTILTADALRLLELAGLQGSDVYRDLKANRASSITLQGVRQIAELAREKAGLPPWPPPMPPRKLRR